MPHFKLQVFPCIQYADIIHGPEKIDAEDVSENDDEHGDEQSIEEALKREVANIKNSNLKERRFKAVKTKVKHVVFIKTTLEEPDKIVNTIFHDIEKTKVKKTRYSNVFNPH